ncbi:MAG: hypothetical protein KGI47_11930 [Betaproteobacteria bacterium]|nr:hypothetical protein [Betaproteobacteria bacterium]MDE2561551.1 hypothetical protein [Sphingomonadales bacterium]MDE2568756.1 hypothetical protein [Sphingomonadales bacterium]
MRISTTGNALSLTFLLTYLPLALLRLTHMAGGGCWYGPMTGAGGMGQVMPHSGWMMNGAQAGGWHMAGYGYGAYGWGHIVFGAIVAYAIGWYVAAVFVSLYRMFARRASNTPD